MTRPAILIIDDVADIVEEMIHLLALLDMPAIGAGSIGRAVDLLAQHADVRLLICDLRLPGENGAEIGARIAGHPGLAGRQFDIIFMSGDADRAERMAADPAAPTILTKPVDPRLLIDTIVAHLDRADLRPGKAARS